MKTIFKLLASGALGGAGDPYTNAQGQQVFAIIGDSKAQGTSPTAGPTPTAGTVKQWNRTSSTIVDVGAGDILYINTSGSQWPRFGIDYNAATGKIPVLVNNGAFGSKLYDAAGTNTWYTNGTLYTNFKSRTDACLAAAGGATPLRLKGVFIIISINDANAGLSDPTIYWASLIDRINADYTGTTIYVSLTASYSAATELVYARYKSVIKQLESLYSNVHVTVNEDTLMANAYTADGIHFNATGNDVFGRMTAAYVASTETDRDLRRLYTCTFVNALSVGAKSAITTFVNSQKSSGRWASMSALQIYKPSTVENAYVDFVGVACPKPVNTVTFSANNYLQTNGTNSYINTQFVESVAMNKATSTDFIMGVGTVVNSTAAGTGAALFGANTAGGAQRSYLRQLASSVLAWAADGSAEDTYAGQTKIQDNTDYVIKRISNTSNELRSNDTSVDTNTNTSGGLVTIPIYVGARNSPGAGDFMNVQVRYFFQAKNTGFDYTTFLSELNTLMAAL